MYTAEVRTASLHPVLQSFFLPIHADLQNFIMPWSLYVQQVLYPATGQYTKNNFKPWPKWHSKPNLNSTPRSLCIVDSSGLTLVLYGINTSTMLNTCMYGTSIEVWPRWMNLACQRVSAPRQQKQAVVMKVS
jgi:hypothetical protein